MTKTSEAEAIKQAKFWIIQLSSLEALTQIRDAVDDLLFITKFNLCSEGEKGKEKSGERKKK